MLFLLPFLPPKCLIYPSLYSFKFMVSFYINCSYIHMFFILCVLWERETCGFMCLCGRRTFAEVWTWRSEGSLRCQSFPSTLIARLAILPASGDSVSASNLSVAHWHYRCVVPCLALCVCYSSNSDPDN